MKVGLLLGAATLLVEAKAEDNKYASMHTVRLHLRWLGYRRTFSARTQGVKALFYHHFKHMSQLSYEHKFILC